MILKTSIMLAILSLMVSFNEDVSADCRNPAIKHQFDVSKGYPHGRPRQKNGEPWIVDHICALACGGIDSITNMQYQSLAESKAKDRWETTPNGCKRTCNATNSTPNRRVFNCV